MTCKKLNIFRQLKIQKFVHIIDTIYKLELIIIIDEFNPIKKLTPNPNNPRHQSPTGLIYERNNY